MLPLRPNVPSGHELAQSGGTLLFVIFITRGSLSGANSGRE